MFLIFLLFIKGFFLAWLALTIFLFFSDFFFLIYVSWNCLFEFWLKKDDFCFFVWILWSQTSTCYFPFYFFFIHFPMPNQFSLPYCAFYFSFHVCEEDGFYRIPIKLFDWLNTQCDMILRSKFCQTCPLALHW